MIWVAVWKGRGCPMKAMKPPPPALCERNTQAPKSDGHNTSRCPDSHDGGRGGGGLRCSPRSAQCNVLRVGGMAGGDVGYA